jgi:hypothetical protein
MYGAAEGTSTTDLFTQVEGVLVPNMGERR